jgi:hypothetical protein
VSSNVIRFFIALGRLRHRQRAGRFGHPARQEIGILRAMGATQAQMRRIFLLQGGIVGFGSLLGSALAWSFLMLWQLLARNADGTPMFVIGVEPGLVALGRRRSLVGIPPPCCRPPRGPTRPGGGDPWLTHQRPRPAPAGIRKSYGSGEVEARCTAST